MKHTHRVMTVVLTAAVAAVLVSATLVPTSTAAEEDSAAAHAAPADGVVTFYFHGNVRCATCRKIEAYADEAIHTGYADALENGTLTWAVVNVDEAENKHFVEDFQLVTRSVVLAEFDDGNVVRWKNLDKVWQLVRDEDAFVAYIREETSAFLEES